MPDSQKTCFVISPIGDLGSDTRLGADDVFELLIQPALEMYGFHVVRADMLVGAGEINSEIISLVQNAELCIIDLTGHNANVFYECGRRHEAAKPFIQLIKAGEKLPFDVAGIRTIQYDISSPRSTRRGVEDIRMAVEQFEASGYPTTTSGVSTTTLAQALERMERKLDSLVAARPSSGAALPSLPTVATGLDDIFASPQEKFLTALASGNQAGAFAALRRLVDLSGNPSMAITCASMLAAAGHEESAAMVRDLLNSNAGNIDAGSFRSAIGALGNFYRMTNRVLEGVEELKRYILPLLSDEAVGDDDKAFQANQLGMLFYSAERYEESQRYTLMAIEKNPGEIAYKYNLSMVYESRGLLDMAESIVDEYMAQDVEKDADHLGQAIDVYLKCERFDDVRALYSQMALQDPGKASIKLVLSDDLRKAISRPE
jgi:tetratricopeptide (TPR) repeat protein